MADRYGMAAQATGGAVEGTLTVRLIGGHGLKLEKWFDDNHPYVTLEPQGFNAQNARGWRSCAAKPPRGRAALQSNWQRGSNPVWDSERNKVRFDVGAGATGAKLSLVCWDLEEGYRGHNRPSSGSSALQTAATTKCIGEGIEPDDKRRGARSKLEQDLSLLLAAGGGDLRAKYPIYGR